MNVLSLGASVCAIASGICGLATFAVTGNILLAKISAAGIIAGVTGVGVMVSYLKSHTLVKRIK